MITPQFKLIFGIIEAKVLERGTGQVNKRNNKYFVESKSPLETKDISHIQNELGFHVLGYGEPFGLYSHKDCTSNTYKYTWNSWASCD